jgi:glycosyltransferase involved in cell wall biosynthesis
VRVSIITVSFNSEKTIRDTIESVLSQDYADIEYIVIDGGSVDGTMGIVSQYGGRISKVVSEPDRGIYDAMNKGMKLADGSIIGFLNSDDMYMSTSSVSQLMSPIITEGVDASFADLVVVDAVDTKKVVRYYDSSFFSPKKFRFGWMPAHPTFFAKKSAYLSAGDYSLDYQIAADYEMLVRMLYVHQLKYAYIKKPLVKMRKGGASSASLLSNWILNCEIVKACRSNGIFTVLPFVLLKIPQKLIGKLWKRGGGNE